MLKIWFLVSLIFLMQPILHASYQAQNAHTVIHYTKVENLYLRYKEGCFSNSFVCSSKCTYCGILLGP
jgi:hypothetical protein